MKRRAISRQLSAVSRSGMGPRAAFSLIELLIAIGILGVGLAMVATIFPVALTQHRISLEQGWADNLVGKAQAILHAKLDPTRFWVNPYYPRTQTDSPWNMLPMMNLAFSGGRQVNWDYMPTATPYLGNPDSQNPAEPEFQTYANALNDASDSSWGNSFFNTGLGGVDILSDRIQNLNNAPMSPFTSEEFAEGSTRFAWVGFYRRLANGLNEYAVAICRVRPNEKFVEQDMASRNSEADFLVARANANVRRLPVPWRVPVVYDRVTKRMWVVAAVAGMGEGLGEIAPPGSKIIVHGRTYSTDSSVLPKADAGTVLTVMHVMDTSNDGNDNPDTIEVTGDTDNLPANQQNFAFDVIVFPPPVIGGSTNNATFAKESPLMEWKAFL